MTTEVSMFTVLFSLPLLGDIYMKWDIIITRETVINICIIICFSLSFWGVLNIVIFENTYMYTFL